MSAARSLRTLALTTLRALAAAGALAACGEDSVTATIGVAGGEIVVGGATVRFPANALAADLEITIRATDEGAPAGFVALSKVFECGPSGTDFAVPVVMEMPFTADDGAATMLWSSGSDPAFKDVGGTAADGRMRAEVRHFSRGFVGRPAS